VAKLRRIGQMKISGVESTKAAASKGAVETKILPQNRPKGLVSAKPRTAAALSPLEKGMAVAEAALRDVPDTRDEIVEELKQRIKKGEYKVSGEEIAEMMLRRRAADQIR
jgi:flagellar biosynthesis anti-sigma factor FlgM